jgi:hypothetical protein
LVVEFDAGDVSEDAVVPELGGERVGGLAGPDEHGEEGFVVDVDDDADPGSVVGVGHGQSRVSSATAFLAQASSTRSLVSAAAAMMAAVAALLSARGSPPEARCSRATASSAKSGSSRPASLNYFAARDSPGWCAAGRAVIEVSQSSSVIAMLSGGRRDLKLGRDL